MPPVPRTSPAASESLHSITGWTLGREIHRGQASSLYLAQAEHSAPPAQNYVVKQLREPGDRFRLAQFRQEAACGRELKHAHLVPVFSARIGPASAHLVMPLIAGASVNCVLESAGSLPLSTAVWIARQVSEALAELHVHGWLHGDVKPANIMVSAEGHATLIDLGFARRLEKRAAVEGPLMGSVAYAAPEIFTSDPLTPAADVYSLAVSLFQMLTGRLPYDGESAEALAEAHLRLAPYDVREIDPLVPRQVAWLLRRALAKQPLRRPSAVEVRNLLAEAEIELISVPLNAA